MGFSRVHITKKLVLATLRSLAWGQHIIIDTGDGELDLNVAEDHGKCSAIFVGASPSTVQYKQLTEYSAKFKVRMKVEPELLGQAQTTIPIAASRYFSAHSSHQQIFAPL